MKLIQFKEFISLKVGILLKVGIYCHCTNEQTTLLKAIITLYKKVFH